MQAKERKRKTAEDAIQFLPDEHERTEKPEEER